MLKLHKAIRYVKEFLLDEVPSTLSAYDILLTPLCQEGYCQDVVRSNPLQFAYPLYDEGDMKHYFNPMSRAVTTHWMLTELDVPHEQIMVDVHAGATDAADFRAINPMGKIPVLVDGDVVVTETSAICTYLADKYFDRGFAPALDSPERGIYYRYLFFTGQTLEPALTAARIGAVDETPRSTGWGDLERSLESVEAMTPETGWVLGDRFSTADVIFGGTLDFMVMIGMLPAPSERVLAYVQRIQARDAYRKSHPQP